MVTADVPEPEAASQFSGAALLGSGVGADVSSQPLAVGAAELVSSTPGPGPRPPCQMSAATTTTATTTTSSASSQPRPPFRPGGRGAAPVPAADRTSLVHCAPSQRRSPPEPAGSGYQPG